MEEVENIRLRVAVVRRGPTKRMRVLSIVSLSKWKERVVASCATETLTQSWIGTPH